MKRLFIVIFILSSMYLAFAEDLNVVKEFLRANMLINEGNIKEAIPILERLNRSVVDEGVVIKLAEVYIAAGRNDDFKKLMNNAFSNETYAKNSTLRRFYASTLANVFNNHDEAVLQMKKAVEIDPSVENYELLAKICEQRRDYACAIQSLDKILEKEIKPEYYYKRGMFYYNLELKDKAIKDFEASLKLEKNFMPLLMLSEIYIQDNQTDKAIQYLEEAVKDKPGLIIPEYRLAELYRVKGDFDKAVKYYELIADKITGREKVYVLKQLAGIFFEKKEYDKSFRWFDRLREEDKSDTTSYYYMGVISEIKKDFESAVKYYKELINRDLKHGFAKKRLAYSYFRLKDYKNALEAIEKMEKDERDVDYYRIKASILGEKGEKKNQLAVLQEALRHYPNNEELLMDIADYYEKIKQYDKVEEYLKRLLALNPNNASALNYLGYLYADLNKNLEEAYVMIEKALKMEPENPAFLDSMAWVLYRLKRYNEAFTYQKRALKLTPNEQEMIDHMKEIMKALGIKKTIDEVLKE
ncbi:MAG: tetratricopeptide repeat protein [Calditerrivibrio sp.]|nr:tetratricopeptide repeat protein [Calditerrivibrio sp.]